MTEQDAIYTYFDGVKEGVWRFAWMKDGVYYVGTTGTTLKDALESIDKEKEEWMKSINRSE